MAQDAELRSAGQPRTAVPTRSPSLFTSLRGGMQAMVDALVVRIPAEARRLNAGVEAVRRESGKWLVISSGRTEEFDAVILATPAYAAAGLTCEHQCRACGGIECDPL